MNSLATLLLLAASSAPVSQVQGAGFSPRTGGLTADLNGGPGALAVPLATAMGQEEAPVTSDGRWYADIDEARRVAAAEGKHVLVNFTGTGWCSWCKRLDAEVLLTAQFGEAAASRFILVKADFDAEGNARTDLPCAAKNESLKAALGVRGFPRIVLMTSDGMGYAELGYERGGTGRYVDKLTGLHAEARGLEVAVPKVTAAIAGAKSSQEALAAADAAAKLLTDAGPHALVRPLVPMVQATLTSLDSARLRAELTAEQSEREAKAILALSGANAVDDALIDRAFRVDPENKAGLPEAALAAAMRTITDPESVDPLIERAETMLTTVIVHDRQVAAQLYGDCAYWIKNWQQDAERARMMASFALGLGPTDENLRSMLKTLAGH